MFCFFGGGLGGNPEGDGLNHANNPISTATIPPLEILESLYPVMFTQWALRPDSGGAGTHRGGLGAIYEIEALADGDTEVFLLGERGKFPPLRRQRRRTPRRSNRFVYDTRAGERHAAARLQDHRREHHARPARAARDAGRRRLRRSAPARPRARSPRDLRARLRLARSRRGATTATWTSLSESSGAAR